VQDVVGGRGSHVAVRERGHDREVDGERRHEPAPARAQERGDRGQTHNERRRDDHPSREIPPGVLDGWMRVAARGDEPRSARHGSEDDDQQEPDRRRHSGLEHHCGDREREARPGEAEARVAPGAPRRCGSSEPAGDERVADAERGDRRESGERPDRGRRCERRPVVEREEEEDGSRGERESDDPAARERSPAARDERGATDEERREGELQRKVCHGGRLPRSGPIASPFRARAAINRAATAPRRFPAARRPARRPSRRAPAPHSRGSRDRRTDRACRGRGPACRRAAARAPR